MMRSPGTVVIKSQDAIVAVLAVLRPGRAHDVASDTVVQLIPHVFRYRIRQTRSGSPRNDA